MGSPTLWDGLEVDLRLGVERDDGVRLEDTVHTKVQIDPVGE